MKTMISIAFGLLVIASPGCKLRRDQVAVEAEAMACLRQRWTFYQAEFPNLAVTNIAQLFEHSTNLSQGYPYSIDRSLRVYGRNAGFEHSFYEKYVLTAAGLRHSNVMGEIILLNARAFPDRRGEMGRMIISKTDVGDRVIIANWYPESVVQQIFHSAGATIPTPQVLPAPPPAPPDNSPRDPITVEELFQRLAVNLGLPRHYWPNVLIGCVVLAIIVIIPTVWLRVRRNST